MQTRNLLTLNLIGGSLGASGKAKNAEVQQHKIVRNTIRQLLKDFDSNVHDNDFGCLSGYFILPWPSLFLRVSLSVGKFHNLCLKTP